MEFDYVLPANEPQWDWQRGQEGNRASNDDLKRLVCGPGKTAEISRLKTKILGPESGNIPNVPAGCRGREKLAAPIMAIICD